MSSDHQQFSARFEQLRRNVFQEVARKITTRKNHPFVISEGRGKLMVLTARRVQSGRNTFIVRGKLKNGEHFECSFSLKFEGGSIG